MADEKKSLKKRSLEAFWEIVTPYLWVITIALIATFLYMQSPGWTLFLFAVVVLGGVVLVTEWSGIGRVSRSRKAIRHEGWNTIGTLEVAPADPYLTFRVDHADEGISVPVTVGKWTAHARSAMTYDGEPRIRDMELRIVRDEHWARRKLEWEWRVTDEPVLSAALGAITEVGRVLVDGGNMLVYAGRRKRRKGAISMDSSGKGYYLVGIARDAEGHVVAAVARLELEFQPPVPWAETRPGAK